MTYQTLTINFKCGGVQKINLHPSFSTSEKVRNRMITPAEKALGLSLDIGGKMYLNHLLA